MLMRSENDRTARADVCTRPNFGGSPQHWDRMLISINATFAGSAIVIIFRSLFHLRRGLQGMDGLIRLVPFSGVSRRCSALSAIILVAITVLPPAPAVAQYAEEWHEWHGQQWNGGARGVAPPPRPSLPAPNGAGHPPPPPPLPPPNYSDNT